MSSDTPLLVTATVWVALACYPFGLLGRTRPASWSGARRAWTLGCVVFLVHAVSAYALVYGWSHEVAVRETARQTAAVTGFDSGVGLYVNFAFAALWLIDATRWWIVPERVRGRLGGPAIALHLFFLFLIVNGAFVFVAGPQRWFGLAIALVGAGLLVHGLRTRRAAREQAIV